LGRKLEREEIVPVPESPARSSGAQSVIKIDETSMRMLQETLTEVTEPEDVTFSTKYRFVNSKVIGKGASGVVRLACRKDVTDSQLSSTTLLAVKEFRRRRRDESQHDYLRKITAEYCIATTMHHVNVVETVDIVHDRERWYEVMEYCAGGDLFNAISHGDLDDEVVDSCFKELVEGVYYLHSLGVAHRDLKPENILVDQDGHVRICDFGVSDVFKVVWERTPHKSRGVCGSCPYIAPEEFSGLEYDAQKVDVWSLGIIYYAMVFRSVPWDEATMSDPVFHDYVQFGQDSFEPFQRLPKHARDLLKGMLQADPGKRLSIDQVRDTPWLKRVPFVPLPVSPPVVINNVHHSHHNRSSSSASNTSSSNGSS
jgi:serine/threonine protein kinase